VVVAFEPGEELGGYVLERLLGAGASARVYLARDGAGNQVAFKLLDLGADLGQRFGGEGLESGARERLRGEATALMRLRIPGIAQVLDLEVDAAEAFLVTDYIPGPTLGSEVAASGPWEYTDAAELGELLSQTLRAVHERGVAHRDIKPANVILSPSGPVLIDFGIAALEDSAGLTRTGLVVGTPGFISPEAIETQTDSDPQADDWWALSALLLFAVTGRAPFGGASTQIQISRVLAGNPDVAGLPAGLVRDFRAALKPLTAGERLEFPTLLESLRQAGLGTERETAVITEAAHAGQKFVTSGTDTEYLAETAENTSVPQTVPFGTQSPETEHLELSPSLLGGNTTQQNLLYPAANTAFPPTAVLTEANSVPGVPKWESNFGETFEDGLEPETEDETEAAPPAKLPFFGLSFALGAALLLPLAELPVSTVLGALCLIGATSGWHWRSRPGFFAAPVALLRGLVSSLPALVVLGMAAGLSWWLGSQADFSQNWQLVRVYGIDTLRLGRCLVVFIGIVLAYALPWSGPMRLGARRIVRVVLPRWWMRLFAAVLLLGACLALVVAYTA